MSTHSINSSDQETVLRDLAVLQSEKRRLDTLVETLHARLHALEGQNQNHQIALADLQKQLTQAQAEHARAQSSLNSQLQQAHSHLHQAQAREVELRAYYGQIRFRLIDRLNSTFKRLPFIHGFAKTTLGIPRKFKRRQQLPALPALYVPSTAQPVAPSCSCSPADYEAWVKHLIATYQPKKTSAKVLIDVVIPVYKGIAETLACIESVLASSCQTPYELIIINDASPEPLLYALLARLARANLITLLENPQNLGFVQTVNRGFALHPDRDVLLLNSDTEVFSDWLDRLRHTAYLYPNVASVTPCSNNATICGYPNSPHANLLPTDANACRLDEIARAVNAHQAVDIPTAVGFCMYIRRDCLQKIGLFDHERFGKGYGEENDFCLRALQQGFRHLQAMDVFVYHSGGVSFGSDKSVGEQRAYAILCERYPQYPHLVAQHLTSDPARSFRRRIDLGRIATNRPAFLMITHHLDGGTELHVLDFAQRLEKEGVPVFILRRSGPTAFALQRFAVATTPNLIFEMPLEQDLLRDTLRQLKVQHIHFHHAIALPPEIINLPAQLQIPYDWTVHDYFAICPRINLTNGHNLYCGEPDAAHCNRCLKQNGCLVGEGIDVNSWRKHFGGILSRARRVYVPHKDVAQRLGKYFPNVTFLEQQHPEPARPARPVAAPYHPNAPLRVALLGTMIEHKGATVLLACAKDALARNLPLHFVVFGDSKTHLPLAQQPHITLTGRYGEDQIFDLLQNQQVHAAFFASVWPETFSYTLSIALAAHLYPIAFDIGAIGARIRELKWGSVIPLTADAATINDQLLNIARTQNLSAPPPATAPIQYPSLIRNYYDLSPKTWLPQ